MLTATGNAGPVLTSVTTAYLPRNLRPEISTITVHPPGTVFQRPFSTGETELAGFDDAAADVRFAAQAAATATPGQPSPTPALGRRIYQKGLQTFVWKADDENDDRLQFDVLYRREGETTWKVLHRGLTDPIFVWDTTSVPDGTYFVKVSASDAPSNSPGDALVGELESVSFDIDNTAPTIELQPATRAGARATITFTCATTSRRFSESSTRSTPAAGGWRIRRTASPTRGGRSSRSGSTRSSRRAASSSGPPTR